VFGNGDIMKPVHTNEDYVKVMLQDSISVFLFTGFGCSDCVGMDTIIAHIQPKFANVSFYKVERDELSDLCRDLGVMSVPSFIAYRDGHEISRYVTPFRKTEQEVMDYVAMTVEKEYGNAKI